MDHMAHTPPRLGKKRRIPLLLETPMLKTETVLLTTAKPLRTAVAISVLSVCHADGTKDTREPLRVDASLLPSAESSQLRVTRA